MIEVASVRLGFAFGLGTATFFAPCAFPLLPGYVAFYLGRDADDQPPLSQRLRRAATVGVVTSAGFFVVYAVLAGLALTIGTQALQDVAVLELVVGTLLLGLGAGMATGRLHLTRLPFLLPERRRSVRGYGLFGVVYAAAAAGCTAPAFIAVASLAVASGPTAVVVLLGAYAAGMSVPMIGVTLLSALGRDTVLRRLSASTGWLSRAAGVVLLVAGAVQLYYYLVVFDGLSHLGG
ncbi:cytochrome C biogenesis protein [Halobellus sp. Atlit-31R]|nr:cytochrome C biogenesis protein [Halobellus sp. Atlit-31R]